MSQRIEENMHLVTYVINKFYGGGFKIAKFHCIETEDLKQIGKIGLIKADRDFTYDKHTGFSTYAIHKIRGEIRRFLRDNNQSVRFPRTIKDIARSMQDMEVLSIEGIIEATGISRLDALGVIDYANRKPLSMSHTIKAESDIGGTVTFEDVLPAKEDTAIEAIRLVELEERLSLLSPKTRQICNLVLAGHDQTSAAKEAGISQSRVSRHLSNAVKLIEKKYST